MMLTNALPSEQTTTKFKVHVEELRETPSEIALRISRLGDDRSIETIIRSIQRMMSGETRVSGEMQALMMLLVLQQRRLIRRYENLVWDHLPSSAYSAQIEGFRITLSPRTRGQWSVDAIHIETGYSHPWPQWQNDLEKAKLKAMLILEEAAEGLASDMPAQICN